ncbi:NADPH:quinone oxidoreductase family protein [Albimonas pacifica]|uniref:NADPH2:quinone reductase n=1 Tax=Albimonas pacifica TaxID=1114924 RepID=A0A1I3M065_9RHOB|nr:NADPH:quinone oxidoreductase family protein [Albimonas pacifica]SFI90451.1 NADPH2:quinone reductase [Albimonas pacifica]
MKAVLMKAVMVRDFGAPGLAQVEEAPVPTPGPGEVLLRVALAPVNFVDLLVIEGKYQFLPPRPFSPGKGPVGTIEAVGEGVTTLAAGDRVLAMAEQGGYAEFCLAPADQCYVLPDAVGFEAAAALSLAYDTAWFALHARGRLAEGETVLALGASGAVGDATVQLAKAAGARVLAGVSSMAKAEAALAAGADGAVDLSAPDLRASLRAQVQALNGGRGVDVIVDPLGGDVFDAAVRALDWCGRLVVVGFAAGRIAELKTNYLLVKNIEVSGLQISDYRKRRPAQVRACFDEVLALAAAGRIAPRPVAAYPLADYATAMEDLRARRAQGRVALRMGEG